MYVFFSILKMLGNILVLERMNVPNVEEEGIGVSMKKQIHVNRQVLQQNKKYNENNPAVSIRTYKGVTRCYKALIEGPSHVIHNEDHPLPCGARVWIETQSNVVALDDNEQIICQL